MLQTPYFLFDVYGGMLRLLNLTRATTALLEVSKHITLRVDEVAVAFWSMEREGNNV